MIAVAFLKRRSVSTTLHDGTYKKAAAIVVRLWFFHQEAVCDSYNVLCVVTIRRAVLDFMSRSMTTVRQSLADYRFDTPWRGGTVHSSPGQDVDRGPPVDRETISGGPPVLHARGPNKSIKCIFTV
jgi:hypothetical protein